MGNQQEESNGKTLIDALTRRFTCKRYDPEGSVSDEDFATILEAARLSPAPLASSPGSCSSSSGPASWTRFASRPGAPSATPTAPS